VGGHNFVPWGHCRSVGEFPAAWLLGQTGERVTKPVGLLVALG
jgi:hypothetical protein